MESSYLKTLVECTYQELVDEIYNKCDHVGTQLLHTVCAQQVVDSRTQCCPLRCLYLGDTTEPWAAGTARIPSTAFCILYRMLTLRVTRNQMRALLNHVVRCPCRRPHRCFSTSPLTPLCFACCFALCVPLKDSPYIRAIGFLYLRFTAHASELYDWYEAFLDDPEEIKPGANVSTTT